MKDGLVLKISVAGASFVPVPRHKARHQPFVLMRTSNFILFCTCILSLVCHSVINGFSFFLIGDNLYNL